MTRVSIPRLHAVRFKDGRAPLRVLHRQPGDQRRRLQLERSASAITEMRPCLAGYAIVAWDDDGSTSVDMGTDGAPVPQMMVPEYVKTCLLDWLIAGDTSKESPESL